MLKFLKSVFLLFLAILLSDAKPNVVIIIADDMGSYDASFRGSNQFLTPNIDALAFNGVTLDRFYTAHMCTPSRASLMTGKYPQSVGMQHWVIPAGEAYGLGLDQKLMSNYFKDAGYKTHLVGKWHLGFYQQKYTPMFRGFDSFYGYYNGLIDYYNYTYIEPAQRSFAPGYDFRINNEVNTEVEMGTYATDLFTDEAIRIIKEHDSIKQPFFLMLNHLAPHTGNNYELMQAPKDEIEKFNHIENLDRRKLAAMISKMDEGIGKVVDAIRAQGLLRETIIMFLSDNGAPTRGHFSNFGSNYPLKGQKDSPWEGATRNLGCIYSPLIKARKRVHRGFFHISDVLPTLASAAGFKVDNVDGIDQWNVLMNGEVSPRTEIVTTLDPVVGFAGIISNQWKLVNGSSVYGLFDFPLGEIEEFPISTSSYANSVLSSRAGKAIAALQESSQLKLTAETISQLREQLKISCNEKENPIIACNPVSSPCLFNIIDDPCERKNVAKEFPAVVDELYQRLIDLLKSSASVRRTGIIDLRSDPAEHQGIWNWWIADKEL